MVAPTDHVSVLVLLLNGDVDHKSVGGGTMPMMLIGLEEDTISWANDLHGTTATLTATHTLDDVDRLSRGMRMPSRAGARREVDARRRQPERPVGLSHGVDKNVAREPVLGTL